MSHIADHINKFSPGKVVATKSVALRVSGGDILPAKISECMNRHLKGDWGDLDEHDKNANDEALICGSQLLSSYKFEGFKIWIITNAVNGRGVRECTTVLFPNEY